MCWPTAALLGMVSIAGTAVQHMLYGKQNQLVTAVDGVHSLLTVFITVCNFCGTELILLQELSKCCR